jgi:hypothetical protein
MSQKTKKRIPILTSNFATLVAGNGYYVDKTSFIHKMEGLNFPNLFLLRPRRFGKSLHLSMLEYYYGIQHRDRFEELFGEYYIGKPENITPLRNSYYILKFNFSGIKTDDVNEIFKHFTSEIRGAVDLFIKEYNVVSESDREEIYSSNDANTILRNFLFKIRGSDPGVKIYLLIDEYDHFTNELFAFNTELFKEIVSRNGWVRKFYEVIKQFMGEGIIDRFFATGVTSVTLDSMTSGFNVAQNITLDNKFHEMAGFTENELIDMIKATTYEEGRFDLDAVVADMRLWYNGSRFSPDAKDKLYNPQMVITFLSNFSNNFTYPREMADINVTSDYTKIGKILQFLPKDEFNAIIEDVFTNEEIQEGLTLQYNLERPYSKTDAVSLLFYNGLLTIEKAVFELVTYQIPNYVIKQLYWEFLRYLYERDNSFMYDKKEIGLLVQELAFDGKIDKLIKYAQKVMGTISFRDLENFRESNLKMIFMTIIMGTNAFYTTSELETHKGYLDLLIRKTELNPGGHEYLLELKYLKKADKKDYNEIRRKGIEQITNYRNSLTVTKLTKLHAYLILFSGKFEVEVFEVE